jgi:hypothetical protein
MFNNFFFPKIVQFRNEKVRKNMVEPDGLEMTIKYGARKMGCACAVRAFQLRQEYRHTLTIFTTYCFFKATVVMPSRLNIRYTCISCLVMFLDFVHRVENTALRKVQLS